MKKTFKLIALLSMLFVPVLLFTQTLPKTLDVHEKDGKITRFSLENIEKITIGGPQIAWTDNMVKDGDGNIYQTVKIGHQVWLASNLKTTKYNDGTPIANITVGAEWSKTKTGAYSWYMNNADNKDVYGALYNWYAVAEDRICPKGYHVPRKEELRALVEAVGVAQPGARLKVAGTQYWRNNKPETDNSSGFSALPGGARQLNASFQGEGSIGRWWAIDAGSADYADFLIMYDNSHVANFMVAQKWLGSSVRCVRD